VRSATRMPMVSTFTANYTLENPALGDQINSWGTTENAARSIADQALAGAVSISVAGGSNAVLSDTQGAVSPAKNAYFTFTGALTANILVLWPNGRGRSFSATNASSGAFSLTLAVNNGSGGAAGASVVIPQGQTMALLSDGTNILPRFTATSGNFTVNGTPTLTVASSGSLPDPTLHFQHQQTGTPAANDFAGVIQFEAKNSTPANREWAQIIALIRTVTAGSEDALLQFLGASAGTNILLGQFGGAAGGGGFQVGSPAGGDQGVGSVNALAYFQNGSPLGITPTGSVVAFAGGTAPGGWRICDGSAISRTTFATLFGIIGTTYGAGDGSTTFNLPDLRGRVVAGFDSGNATGRLTASTAQGVSAAALGNTGGEQAHTLSTAELAVHNHGVSDPGHTHQMHGDGGLFSASAPLSSTFADSPSGANLSEASTSSATGIAIQNAGGSNAHNTLQPTIVLTYIIKT